MLSVAKGLGYEGNHLGVDRYTTTHVLDDSTDVWGGMFGRGAIVYGIASPGKLDLNADQVVLLNRILFDRIRDFANDEQGWGMAIYAGATELLDLCGVSMRCGRS